jgi:hypothetical protein
MRGVRAPVVFVMFCYGQISLMPDSEITGFSGLNFVDFITPLHRTEQGCTKQRGLSGFRFSIRVVHGK